MGQPLQPIESQLRSSAVMKTMLSGAAVAVETVIAARNPLMILKFMRPVC